MFWRKVFDHNPLFVTFCDKIATKEYIRTILPEARLPETLWVGSNVDDIPEELKTRDLVLKANHGSSQNHFGRLDGGMFDDVRKKTSRWLQCGYGRCTHEWGYFRARRLLFLEERLSGADGDMLVDVSVRCSDGSAILASAITGNKTDHRLVGYYDIDGNRMQALEEKFPSEQLLPEEFELPASFSLAVDYARRLSRGVDYARYDFLCIGQRIYPGEITVYPGAGMTSADDDGLDHIVLEGWDISRAWFLQTPQSGWRAVYARAARQHFKARER